MRVAFRSVRVGAGVPRTVERDARGGSDPVAGFDESAPQGGQFDVEESTAVPAYAAVPAGRVVKHGGRLLDIELPTLRNRLVESRDRIAAAAAPSMVANSSTSLAFR